MSPIAIGGLGGSGTRVIAELLLNCEIYMGYDLDQALDNLMFTFLFKRPLWFLKTESNKIENCIKLFEKIMIHEKLNVNDYILINKTILSHIATRSHNLFFLMNRLRRLITLNDKLTKHKIWGWKEPNTYIFLNHLANYFNDLKYIHVIRHGLDMAYSNNLQQLHNWGNIFGIKIPKNIKFISSAQLEFWIKANNFAISNGRTFLGNSFYLLNYDKLCFNPKESINNLLKFLDLRVDRKKFESLINIPQIPATLGRWKSKNTDIFTETQIKAVANLGFEI